MRPPEDYQPGPPLLSGAPGHLVCRVRSAEDALHLLALDDDGGVTQSTWVMAHMLREAGVPGIPDDHAAIHELYQFAWSQGRCPAVMGQPARHDVMAACIAPYYSKSAVETARPAIRKLAAVLLDEQLRAGGGTLDAARFARSLAFRATAELAGFPCSPDISRTLGEMFEKFARRTTVAVIPEGDPVERAFLGEILRSGAPGLIADLREAEQAGLLSPVECLAVVRGVWAAGTDTTGATTATLLALLGDPAYRAYQDQARARAGAERQKLLRRYALETARLFPSFPEIALVTYTDVRLPSGTVLPRGTHVLIVVPAVNRDEQIASADPEEFRADLHRRRSLAFGAGLHACTGRYAALAIVEEGVGEVLDRTTCFALTEGGWAAQSGIATHVSRALLDCSVPSGA
jgi:cytochrome P450